MKKIIILGVNAVSAKYVPRALRTAGYEPVFLVDPREFAGEVAANLRDCACVPVDTEDRAGVLRLLAEDPSVIGDAFAITGLFDELFPLIEEIAAAHGLCRPDPVVARLASKGEVASIIPEFCPPTMRFTGTEAARLGIDPAAVAPAPGGHMLKPAEQAGGRGVTRLPRGAGPEAVRDAVAASGLAEGHWVLQADITGTLFSLEGYVTEGRIVFICFSQRGRIGWTEVSNLLPADDRLPEAVKDRCRAAVTALIERSGLSRGYFHSEFLVAGDRPFLIDANVGRLGGAAIVEQLALSSGLDAGEILGHVLTLGLPDAVTSPEPAYRTGDGAASTTSYFYGIEGGGRVTSVSVPHGRRCLHTQVVRDGGRVGSVGAGDGSWVGTLTGLTPDVAEEIEEIVVHTAEGPRRPAWVALS
jgi:hypothetical protein